MRRRAVLEAALECFAETDVESASIAAICARSGASVGSVYHHFGSKEGIMLALLADGLEAHLKALGRALEHAGGDPFQCVEAVVGSLIDWVELNPRWAMFIYANLNSSGASSAEPIIEINRRYGKLVERYFDPLIESGQIRRLPRECWPSLIVAPAHDYARRWLRDQVRNSPSRQRQVFIDAAWRIVQPD
ncbi:MAG TPA: TetR/AcrR family transcriptional regulator [Wenzhouxiangellaceae bacterium]|nr:TetR/AcrR family transcriptional regulator [Wenzhouxiangellaceae bacterium]